MKLLTKEEEQEHYNATLIGGIGGGVAGLAVGLVGVYAAQTRYPAFRSLTLPLKAFLITSSGTFSGKLSLDETRDQTTTIISLGPCENMSPSTDRPSAIISADRYSRSFEAARHSNTQYKDSSQEALAQDYANKSPTQKALDWGRENRYPIVGVSWLGSMVASLALVGRNPYLTTAQKLVQARVYAQGLTLAVLLASALFEIGDKGSGKGMWETIKVIDPKDPTHKHVIEKKVHHEAYRGEDQWRDMIEAEEQKMKEREEAVKEQERRDEKEGKTHHKKRKVEGKKGEKKDDKEEADGKDEGKEEK
ncbi:hypothetical protein MMC25_000935 [Agyrium rufum]|nr:hypothetical protein [Agyrium rufum]